MALKRNLFTYGRLDQRCSCEKRDISGVASHELVALLKEVGLPPTRKELSVCSGVSERLIHRIFGSPSVVPQPFSALLTADRLLTGLGAEYRIHELTIIPNEFKTDALKMAQFEFVDCDGTVEVLTGTPEQHQARADELMALRETLIGAELRRVQPQRTRESASRAAHKATYKAKRRQAVAA